MKLLPKRKNPNKMHSNQLCPQTDYKPYYPNTNSVQYTLPQADYKLYYSNTSSVQYTQPQNINCCPTFCRCMFFISVSSSMLCNFLFMSCVCWLCSLFLLTISTTFFSEILSSLTGVDCLRPENKFKGKKQFFDVISYHLTWISVTDSVNEYIC